MTTVRRPAPRPLTFQEVNPKFTSDAFRRYVGKALEVLRQNKTPVARATLKAIESGRVKIDVIEDLTRPDFRRVRKDLLEWKISIKETDYARLHDERSGAYRAIAKTLNGYMWDDRVYLHHGLSPKKLASTLVHEVNHVLNKSEEHYRGPRAALLEEYRAFYAEKLLAGVDMTPARCRALKADIIKEYELKGVRPDDIPDVVPPNK